MEKIRVGLVYGGRSFEHEISILSARNVLESLDQTKYEPVLLFIDKEGHWYLRNELDNSEGQKAVMLAPKQEGRNLFFLTSSEKIEPIEIAFPILHGVFGEDGTIQGLFKMVGLPFVGPGVLGSAICMDKEVVKRLLLQAGKLTAQSLLVRLEELTEYTYERCKQELGIPFFVKPANGGSAVGVSKVRNEVEFLTAMEEAFLYDKKVMVEEFIEGREIECPVLGNQHPEASVPGEVVSTHDFYSYTAKYLDEKSLTLLAPAPLDDIMVKKVQKEAIEVFQLLCCEGMARVDFFLTKNGALYVNEVNTIPGFTNLSLYPVLWGKSGFPASLLLDKLIQLGLERFNSEQRIQTTYQRQPA